MKNPFILFIFALFFSFNISAEEPSAEGGHIQCSELAPEIPLALADSIRKDQKFEAGARQPAKAADSAFANIWRYNKVDWDANIDSLKLKFVDLNALADDDIQDRTFDVSIIFQPNNRVVVKNSAAANKRYLGGLRFSFDENRSWKSVLAGTEDKSVAAIIPRVIPGTRQSLLICPLNSQAPAQKTPTPSAESKLKKNGRYQVGGVSFTVSARAVARLQSGVGVGYARAAILTSPNILRSDPLIDEALSKDPSVSVEYTADSHEQIEAQPLKDKYCGAVQVEVIQHNSAGYKRESKLEETAWINNVELNSDITARLGSGDINLRLGSCVSIIKDWTKSEAFSKVKLALATPTPEPTPESSAE